MRPLSCLKMTGGAGGSCDSCLCFPRALPWSCALVLAPSSKLNLFPPPHAQKKQVDIKSDEAGNIDRIWLPFYLQDFIFWSTCQEIQCCLLFILSNVQLNSCLETFFALSECVHSWLQGQVHHFTGILTRMCKLMLNLLNIRYLILNLFEILLKITQLLFMGLEVFV